MTDVCSTCGKERDDNPICSNVFHVAHLVESAEPIEGTGFIKYGIRPRE